LTLNFKPYNASLRQLWWTSRSPKSSILNF